MAEYQEYSDSMSGESAEEVWSSNSQTSSDGNLSWISWWCAQLGHEFFTEVPEDFIEDDFNMTGLSSLVGLYREALELILDLEPDDDTFGAADQEEVENASDQLYGLIHQRYICSRNGLVAMAEKYETGHFGVCPRLLCAKTAVLPIGLSDVQEEESVKLYCPTCMDVYNPPNSRFNHIDGAYFGTTFPHLFFMTFPELLPRLPKEHTAIYIPRIYGFRVSQQARCGPKMAWLRQYIQAAHRAESEHDSEEEGREQNLDAQLQDAENVQPAASAGVSLRTQNAQADIATIPTGKDQLPYYEQANNGKRSTSNGPATMSGRTKQLVGVREVNFAG